MEVDTQLTQAALRWLDKNGDLTRLQVDLHARAALTPKPKVIAAPVYVDLAHLYEMSGEGKLFSFVFSSCFLEKERERAMDFFLI